MANGDGGQPAVMSQHESFSEFVSTHQGLVIGGGLVLILILAGFFMNSKNKTLPVSTATGDLSGLQNGNLVYVPTSTTFSTQNIRQGAFSNDPNLTTVTNSPVNSGNPTTSTTTTTTTNNPPPTHSGPGDHPDGGGTRQPPTPVPPPPTHNKGLIWDQGHTVLGGETLSAIAAAVTRQLRAQGMPGSMSVSWNDLYAHNQAVVTQYANMHGFRADVWNWIFPGERITVPRWG